ncbi:hypothetical protein BO94DRAFT_587369 [Aspergillus sclerotioniger CBS 115572]|uniref:Retrotransposon gag domain-containing protein n=1 Tax=Aspergillus sclerotioniger CBS 115572 TaxID=1450535 RepID=A0A317W527_9EURO|nr:hypothetical protein BO94DRAFT_587369 [Aspergillus sclerotioniger CBS 115572]PWY81664.1 hypothetical protein BO94DRAFT_587369 [Aspergillus sclerotioniger CBS 115572]
MADLLVLVSDTDDAINREFDQLKDELKKARDQQHQRALRPRSPNEVASAPNPPLATIITRPSFADYSADDVLARGIKRSYSEEAEDFPQGEPPSLALGPIFHESPQADLQEAISRLEEHFAQWGHYYYSDERKIMEGRRHMSILLLDKWTEHVMSNPGLHTWHGFRSFVLHREVKSLGSEEAARRYDRAFQKPTQSVRDHASHLTQLEHEMGVVFDDDERILKLYDTILPEVRAIADHPRWHQSDFRAWVKRLSAVELQIPCRYQVIGRKLEMQRKRRRI